MDVGAQRILGEVLLPQARCQQFHLARRMLSHALQDIDEVVVRIDTVQATSDDEGVGDTNVMRADLGGAKQPRLATHGNRIAILPMSGRKLKSIIAGIRCLGAVCGYSTSSGAWLGALHMSRFHSVSS